MMKKSGGIGTTGGGDWHGRMGEKSGTNNNMNETDIGWRARRVSEITQIQEKIGNLHKAFDSLTKIVEFKGLQSSLALENDVKGTIKKLKSLEEKTKAEIAEDEKTKKRVLKEVWEGLANTNTLMAYYRKRMDEPISDRFRESVEGEIQEAARKVFEAQVLKKYKDMKWEASPQLKVIEETISNADTALYISVDCSPNPLVPKTEVGLKQDEGIKFNKATRKEVGEAGGFHMKPIAHSLPTLSTDPTNSVWAMKAEMLIPDLHSPPKTQTPTFSVMPDRVPAAGLGRGGGFLSVSQGRGRGMCWEKLQTNRPGEPLIAPLKPTAIVSKKDGLGDGMWREQQKTAKNEATLQHPQRVDSAAQTRPSKEHSSTIPPIQHQQSQAQRGGGAGTSPEAEHNRERRDRKDEDEMMRRSKSPGAQRIVTGLSGRPTQCSPFRSDTDSDWDVSSTPSPQKQVNAKEKKTETVEKKKVEHPPGRKIFGFGVSVTSEDTQESGPSRLYAMNAACVEESMRAGNTRSCRGRSNEAPRRPTGNVVRRDGETDSEWNSRRINNRKKINLLKLVGSNKRLRAVQKRQVGTFGVDLPATRNFSAPIGCCKDEETGDWIVCDTNHNQVKVYDEDWGEQMLIGGSAGGKTSFVNPSGVVVVRTRNEEQRMETMWAVKDDHSIQLFRRSGELVRKIQGPDKLISPYGLALTGEGYLLTLNSAVFSSAKTHVILFDPATGEVVKRIPYNPRSGGKCRFLDVLDDKLVVTDLGQDRVYVSSLKDGETILEFGTQGFKPSQFKFVSGVALDGFGNMLIGDAKNNRIQLFDNEGNFVTVLDMETRNPRMNPATCVSHIHLTNDGDLVVMSRSKHVVTLFSLQASS